MMGQAVPDPIGELGRGVMRATEGMTPEQKIAYIQQNAASGIAPQSVLFLMMKQQERLRAAQPPAQSMPTVRERLAAATAPMEQGIAGIPTGVMNNASYAGGGIVAFARGGTSELEGDETAAGIADLGYGAARAQLVAMIQQAEAAGQTERAAQLRNEYRKLEGGVRSAGYLSEGARRSMGLPVEAKAAPAAAAAAPSVVEEDMVEAVSKGPSARRGPRRPAVVPDEGSAERVIAAPRVVAPPPAAPAPAAAAEEKPSGYAARLAEIRKLQEAQGIGGASAALAALLDKEEAAGKKQAAEDRRMALAQAGFAMAEAAGRPGAKFLGAAGVGGQSYVANRVAADKAARDYQRTLARERINLQRADEALKMGNINLAIQLEGQAEERAAKAKEVASRNALAYYTANLEATLGAERTAATLRGQNLEMMLKISEQTADQIAALSMNPEYLKAKPEDQVRMRNAIMENGNKMVTNMLGAGALGDTKNLSGGIKFLGFEG